MTNRPYRWVPTDTMGAERLLEAKDKRIHELEQAAKQCIRDAAFVCGSDGKGCGAFRDYYGDDHQRRWRKCGHCPMEALIDLIDVVGWKP